MKSLFKCALAGVVISLSGQSAIAQASHFHESHWPDMVKDKSIRSVTTNNVGGPEFIHYREFDRAGRLIKTFDGGFVNRDTTYIEYDEEGREIAEEENVSSELEYDAEGRLVKAVYRCIKCKTEEDRWENADLFYTYNDDGTLAEVKRKNSEDRFGYNVTRYTYEDGLLTYKKAINVKGEIEQVMYEDKYVYLSGNLDRIITTRGINTWIVLFYYEGDLPTKSMSVWKMNGEIKEQKPMAYTYRYW